MKKVSTPKQNSAKPKLHTNSNNKLPSGTETFDISVDILSSRLNLGEGKGVFLSNVLKYKKNKKSNKEKDAKPASKNVKKKERKAKRLINHKKKGSGTANHNHRQRKRRGTDIVEVTTCAVDILESKSDMDDQYLILKERVLSKLPCPEKIVHINHSTKLEERITNIFETSPDPELNTLYLVDLTTVIIKYKDWVECLPMVEPFYAMKCNPDDNIVSSLVACGAGLDCASMEEMKVALSKGLTGDKIIFANPCKMLSHIKFAKENGISMMTFDNKAELLKVHSIHPQAKMVLRILGDDSHSTMRFGSKFGANVHTEARPLLECAYSLGLEVIGVSFHVGSGCQSAEAYTNSLSLALHVFDIAAELGHPMSFLDIGGGTPGVDTDDLKFGEIAKTISRDLKQMFPPNVRVIAEPGRYFASECVVLVTSVIAKRERTFASEEPEDNKEMKRIDYYISDGVYGSFNNLFFDHANALPVPMHRNKKTSPTREDGEIPNGSEPIPVPNPDSQQDSDNSSDDNSWGSPPSSYPDLHSDSVFENRAEGSPCDSSSNTIEDNISNDPVAPASNQDNIINNKNRSTVFGPTCDSIDLICKDVELPDLEIGDFVYFMNMGAYTSAAASSFNGFKPPQTVYMIS